MPVKLIRRSDLVFAALCAVLVLIKLFFDLLPQPLPVAEQAAAFSWPIVLAIIFLGFLGLLADRSLGFAQPLEDVVRDATGLKWSISLGLAYGMITVALAFLLPDRGTVARPDWTYLAEEHMALPWSIPFYTFGTILLEFMLRLGGLCILVWIFGAVIFRRRYIIPIFWVINCAIALYEPLPGMLGHAGSAEWLSVALALVSPLYLSNVLEGYLLLRFGWIAPLVFRWFFYLVWHLGFGGLARHMM